MSLVKQLDGSFELTTPLPFDEDVLLYKFVVDGKFKVSDKYPVTKDAKGFDTNYLNLKDLEEKSELAESRANEEKTSAEGTGVATGVTAGALASEEGSQLGTTVMPKEDSQHPSIAGEPGIVIPNSENLLAFNEYSNVDAKELNDTIAAEEKKKQKKKVKRTQYKAKRKQKAEQGTAEPVSGIDLAGNELYNQPSSPYNSTEAETEEGTPEPKNLHGYKAAGVLEEKVPVSSDVGDTLKVGEKSTSKDDTSKLKGAAPVEVSAFTDKPPAKENVDELKPGAGETADSSTAFDVNNAEKQQRKELKQGSSKDLEEKEGAIPSTLDPKAQHATREKGATKDAEKEGKAAEHTATPKKESGLEDEEIIIAQGNASARELEAAIRRDEPEGVSIEEYQPTAQEKAEFAKEAHIIEQAVAPSPQTPLPTSGGSPSKAQGKSPKSSKSFKSSTEEKAAPESAAAITLRSESTATEPAKAESAKAKSTKAEAVKAESAKAESAKAESAKAESAKAEAVKAESAKAGWEKAKAEKTEVANIESRKTEPAKAESEAAKDIHKGGTKEASKTHPEKEEPTKEETAKGQEKGNENKEPPKKKGFFSKLKKMFK